MLFHHALTPIAQRAALLLALITGVIFQANAATELDRQAQAAINSEAKKVIIHAPEKMGEATEQLLQAQRTARAQYPRPITGEQASRSYQRYLKSFEFAIPEHFPTGLDTGSSSGGR